MAAKLLRCPTDPETSFGDDPLRMLRLFRFMSTLGFTPDAGALQAVREMRSRLQVVSEERIQAVHRNSGFIGLLAYIRDCGFGILLSVFRGQ